MGLRWGFAPNPTKNLRFLDFPLRYRFAIADVKLIKTARSDEGSLRELASRARIAGFSVMEIRNHKRLRFYASFPDRQPNILFPR